MIVDYQLSKIVIRSFRGVADLTLELRQRSPCVLIGSNNAGKSTILNAIALALNGGGYHQWTPSETDFYIDNRGNRATEFLVQVHFKSDNAIGYPAVRGVGKPVMVRGVQVKGKLTQNGRMTHSRTLFDDEGKAITLSTRTPLSAADKAQFADHDVGYRISNARLDDIRDHSPEVWFFRPQNIEASLYIWKTGPIAKLSSLLADRFVTDSWEMTLRDGTSKRPMPSTVYRAHEFLQDALEQHPFWEKDMKPHLEAIIGRYVGTHAKIDLKPDAQLFEEWIAQQLAVSLATDPDSATTPLRNMGDGWQSVIRLAALEALTKYPQLIKDRVVLLLEEPETHLHPHLRRKLRRVLLDLSKKGWAIVYSTHAPEMVSFENDQLITRLTRAAGSVDSRSIHTDSIGNDAAIQSKIDDRGAHDFLFSTAVIFCEGKSDQFAVKTALEKMGVDCDALSVSIIQCGSVSAIPAFAQISKELGIRWCALTDQDVLDDGCIKPATSRARANIEVFRTAADAQVQWRGDIEKCLAVTTGKASSEICWTKLSDPEWRTKFPDFTKTIDDLAGWITTAPHRPVPQA